MASNPGETSTDGEWNWHILLSRPYYAVNLAGAPRSVLDRGVTMTSSPTTFGWKLTVYRLEANLFDNENKYSSNNQGVKPFLPRELAEKLRDEFHHDDDPAGLFDFSNPNYLNSLDELIRAPFGCMRLLALSRRVLLDYMELINTEEFPVGLIKRAMQVLGLGLFRGAKRILTGDSVSDAEDFNQSAHDHFDNNETDWAAAVKQRPRTIHLHIPLPEDVVSEKDINEMTKQIHLAFPKAKIQVNRDLTDDNNTNGETRLLWALEFANQMFFRFVQRGQLHERKSGVPGIYDFGIRDYYLHGTKLKEFPSESEYNKYRSAYSSAAHLLALRPWSVFAPFEILKIVISDVTGETIRWVMFSAEEASDDGSDKSNCPFGLLQINERFEDLEYAFGSQNMLFKSGMTGSYDYPDRLYIGADIISGVHYDTIYLLAKLFGNPFGSVPVDEDHALDFGWLPTLEVETGPIEDFMTADARGRPRKRRPLAESELLIAERVCSSLINFVKEQKALRFKPTDGKFERTYPADFRNTGAASTDSVKVVYNMDKENDGLWDTDVKWMWFE